MRAHKLWSRRLLEASAPSAHDEMLVVVEGCCWRAPTLYCRPGSPSSPASVRLLFLRVAARRSNGDEECANPSQSLTEAQEELI